MGYFEEKQAISSVCGGRIREVLDTVAYRYIGENPPHPVSYYVYQTNGFSYGSDGRIDFNLNKKFPDSRCGEWACMEAKFWKDSPAADRVQINCYGPVRIYLNGDLVFRSSVREEVNRNAAAIAVLNCEIGWNTVRILCQKAASGFGCIYGSVLPKWRWHTYFAPVPGREGILGFVYRMLTDAQVGEIGSGEADAEPKETAAKSEEDTWLPQAQWTKEQQEWSPVQRIFGSCPGKFIYGWSRIETGNREKAGIELRVETDGETAVFLDGQPVFCRAGDGAVRVFVKEGAHSVTVRYCCPDLRRFGYRITAADGAEEIPFFLPFEVSGAEGGWLYAGPFTQKQKMPEGVPDRYRPVGEEEKTYWRVDRPCGILRPVLENERFGRWNYPIGVTLYGLIKTARYLEDTKLLQYAKEHIGECLKLYRYSLWDKEAYGYPEVNIQIANVSMLDDCGSFANAVLELDDAELEEQTREAANDIAFYMETVQERRPDGAFYRICRGSVMEDTLWADDLFMSVPFLCRYYKRSGRKEVLEDAVNQIRQYKKYLYMNDCNLMSHVYNFKYGTKTGVAWGRGNGWVYVSLSELLLTLPDGHKDRSFLLDFYNLLTKGLLRAQDEDGMWHQVLTDRSSYQEASCTAMMIYGMCIGVRKGWLKGEQRKYAFHAAKRGWKGMTRLCIDKRGNVYGISGGSDYSFTASYYKDDLPWVMNDPHGIGIVLLAGIELLRVCDKEGLDRNESE